MLTKEKFIKYLDQICEYADLQDNLNNLTRKYDLLELNVTLHEYLSLELLTELMNDIECGWIMYWFYELDRGKKDGKVTSYDDKPIPLTTKEDLYNLLVGEI